MQTVEHATQSAYLAVQITVENAARRHSVEMVRHSQDYDTCKSWCNSDAMRDLLAKMPRSQIAEAAATLRDIAAGCK